MNFKFYTVGFYIPKIGTTHNNTEVSNKDLKKMFDM